MSYSLHAYLTAPDKNYDESWAFDAIKSLFHNSSRIEYLIGANPLTKQNILKLKIDGAYSISVFFEKGVQVQSDLKAISGTEVEMPARIRVLFAPDPNNDYDDIAVIILTFLEQLEKVIVYSANQRKIIFKAS